MFGVITTVIFIHKNEQLIFIKFRADYFQPSVRFKRLAWIKMLYGLLISIQWSFYLKFPFSNKSKNNDLLKTIENQGSMWRYTGVAHLIPHVTQGK